MENIPLMIDLILICIIILCAVKGYIEGFFTSLINLIGRLAGFILAWYVSSAYSEKIFVSFFRQKTIDSVYEYLISTSDVSDVKQVLGEFVGIIPDRLMDSLAANAQGALTNLSSVTQQAAVSLVDSVIGPVIIMIISVVLFAAVSVVAGIVISVVSKMLTFVNKIPLLGFANKLAGFGTGIVIGIVNIIIISFVLTLIAIITKNSLSFLNMEVLTQSSVLSYTGIINPFMG